MQFIQDWLRILTSFSGSVFGEEIVAVSRNKAVVDTGSGGGSLDGVVNPVAMCSHHQGRIERRVST